MEEDKKPTTQYKIHLSNGTLPIEALRVEYLPELKLEYTTMEGTNLTMSRSNISRIEAIIPEEKKGSNLRGEGRLITDNF